jgi:hypothetical protein
MPQRICIATHRLAPAQDVGAVLGPSSGKKAAMFLCYSLSIFFSITHPSLLYSFYTLVLRKSYYIFTFQSLHLLPFCYLIRSFRNIFVVVYGDKKESRKGELIALGGCPKIVEEERRYFSYYRKIIEAFSKFASH